MRVFASIVTLLALLLLIFPVIASTSIDEIRNTEYYYSAESETPVSASSGLQYWVSFGFKDITQFDDIVLIQHVYADGKISSSSVGVYPFVMSKSGVTYGTGTLSIFNVGGTTYSSHLQFDYWTRGSLTGEQVLDVTYPGGAPASGGSMSKRTITSNTYACGFYVPGQGYFPYTLVNSYFEKDEMANVYSNETGSFSSAYVARVIDGLSYTSNVTFTRGDGYVVSSTNTNTNSSPVFMVDYTTLSVIMPSGYCWSKVYNPTGNYSPTPTPTPTPTATPTPGTDLCQYWSLSLNTSNINRNEAVLGTLTETDPEDRYDMIDWYRVLPNGAEYITKHYIYDSGLFGLGAGWFLVDSYTGYTEASSVDEALENEIDFTTSGGAHYVRVRIYDDKSLLPLVYHDYDHVCTKESIVYVGETTQSLTQQGINVYEADTNAFLSDVSLSVYDYGSGEWQNKTSTYGSTTYFNAVPGHSMRVLANKTGWLSSDSTFTVANPPVPYAVYLKRPLPDIVNKSYAFFNVRDSVSHTGLYQATIQLSDGQLQSTLPSGYAGFSVNDSESYYYTVSKPGYQTLTSTFSISEDTTIPVLLVQIAPTPTVTLPITTLPTVTVTGTLTPTVTGTTTLTATATGTYSNATLAAAERVQKTTKAADVWYTNAETLSNLLFLAVIVGVLGLMSNAMDKRRRRR